MDLNTVDVIKKKILDAQQMVKDYESYSKNIKDNQELSETFRIFAEQSGMQARRLQEFLENQTQQTN